MLQNCDPYGGLMATCTVCLIHWFFKYKAYSLRIKCITNFLSVICSFSTMSTPTNFNFFLIIWLSFTKISLFWLWYDSSALREKDKSQRPFLFWVNDHNARFEFFEFLKCYRMVTLLKYPLLSQKALIRKEP